MASMADRIREHTRTHHIEPARQAGKPTVEVRAGDVHKQLGLKSRFPAVCSALASGKFLRASGLRVLAREGPRQSTTTLFRYAVGKCGTPGNIEPASTASSTPTVAAPAGVAALDIDGANPLFLVSCVKSKLRTSAKAEDLYTSAWFRLARAAVEKTGSPWRILSAQHGLLAPETRIRPYEKTLNKMRVAERRAWAASVRDDLAAIIGDFDTVVIFAGQRYREFLEPWLRDRADVRVPMSGLRQGEQLAWLKACLDG